MTPAHGAPDLDLLADYLADALPVDEAAQVSERIAREPRWRAAHDALAGALPAVQHELSGFAVDLAIPGDVAARLDAALRAEADRPLPGGLADKPRTTRDDPNRPPGRRDGHRPRARRYAPRVALALFAVFIAVAGVGFAIRFGPSTAPSSATGADGRVAAPEAAPPSDRALTIVATGHNYTPAELRSGAQIAKTLSGGSTVPGPLLSGPRGTSPGYDTAFGPLNRLTTRSQLDACLADVAATRPRSSQPDIVDFANFNGRPALIIHLVNPPAILAVGPACGIEGPDVLFATSSR